MACRVHPQRSIDGKHPDHSGRGVSLLELAVLQIEVDVDCTNPRSDARCFNGAAPDILARSPNPASSLTEYGHLIIDTLTRHRRDGTGFIAPRDLRNIHGSRFGRRALGAAIVEDNGAIFLMKTLRLRVGPERCRQRIAGSCRGTSKWNKFSFPVGNAA